MFLVISSRSWLPGEGEKFQISDGSIPFSPNENDGQERELQNYGENLAFPTSKFPKF
jgi:hypothetical protein